MLNYLLSVLIALDRMVNALIGGNDKETLSSVAYRKWRDKEPFGFMMHVVNTIMCSDTHCLRAYSDDRLPNLPA